MPVARPAIIVAIYLSMLMPAPVFGAKPSPWRKALSDGGLRLGPAGKLMPFGTPRTVALRQLSEAFGAPVRVHTIPDCGQGEPMTEAAYRGSLTITFYKGKLSGWTLDKGATMGTDRDITVGSPRAAVKRAYPDMSVDSGSLGVMFTTEQGISGFLDADRPSARVIGLFAGETCMVS